MTHTTMTQHTDMVQHTDHTVISITHHITEAHMLMHQDTHHHIHQLTGDIHHTGTEKFEPPT